MKGVCHSVIVTGGLGNQMFQYALAMSLRSRGFNVKLDISTYDFLKMHNGYELDRVFGINETLVRKQGLHMLWLRILAKLSPKGLYVGDNSVFDEMLLRRPARYVFGTWFDERYFTDIKDDIVKKFSFRNIDAQNTSLTREIKLCQSVSIHIRRGDYSDAGMTIIGSDYYQRAVKYVTSHIDEAFFYVFSDDAAQAKNIVDELGVNYRLITHNRGQDSYKDMFLMTQCKHNIIANSSFSWWGAWLNKNEGKMVVAPNIWNKKKTFFTPQAKEWHLE